MAAAFQVYQFLCVKCSEPLFSSLANSWLRVSRNHITFTPHTPLEALPSLDVHDDVLGGSNELDECEIRQLHCSNCLARVGVKCIDAAPAKQGFIDRYFIRQVALTVHGLTPQWSQNADSEAVDGWSATSGLHPVIHDPSAPLADLLRPPASREVEPIPRVDADQPSPRQADYELDEELKDLVGEHTRTLAQLVQMVSDLRGEIASVNHSLNKRKKLAHRRRSREREPAARSQNHGKASPELNRTTQLPTPMDLDPPALTHVSSVHPPTKPSSKARPIANTPTIQDTQQYLEQTVVSDDLADSDFELSDASQAKGKQVLTESIVSAAQERTDQVPPPLTDKPSNLSGSTSTPDAPRRSPDGSPQRRSGQFAIRGRSSRRGFSGRRPPGESNRLGKQAQPGKQVLSSKQALPGHVLPGGRKEVKVRTTQLHNHRRRSTGYRSSPLATSFSADDTSDSPVDASAHQSSPRPAKTAQAPKAPASSMGPHATGTTTHKVIMQLVKKGMHSNYAKSRLAKGAPGFPAGSISDNASSSRLAMAT